MIHVRETLFTLALGLGGGLTQGAEEAPPSAELLEFVGTWESVEGVWFDPSQLEGWIQDEGDGGETHEDDA